MRFERVRIYRLDEIVRGEPREFDKCAPTVKANPWIENPTLVRKNIEVNFLDRLIYVVKSLATRGESEYSPLLEMVGKMFKKHDKVILVSDLMHHVPEYSLYKSPQNRHIYETFEQTPYARTVTPNMQEKELVVVYLKRQKLESLQNETLQDFWSAHVERNAGKMQTALTLSTIN